MIPVPEGTKDFTIANVIVGTVDDAADFTGNLIMDWDADSLYMTFIITDDSIVNAGTAYQVDNLEIYLDLDNSKTVHYPRNQGWQGTVDYTYDDNDFQFRLVPDSAFSVNNGSRPSMVAIGGVKQVYTVTDTGYIFILNIAWDSLSTDFEPADSVLIGFDVLASDNDAVASDANRNQITFNSPTDKAYNDPSLWATLMMMPDGWEVIPDEDEPLAPTGLVGVNDSDKVALSWNLAVDNIAVMSYNIFQGATLLGSVYAEADGNDFLVSGLAEGNYSFGVQSVDNYGLLSNNATIYVDVVYPQPYAVELAAGEQFKVYPNPATTDLHILSNEAVEGVQIISITGTRVMNLNNVDVIDVSSLKDGIYLVKVQTASGVYSDTFIKN